MDKLYKKVIKGLYPKTSNNYSADLAKVINLMLQVQPNFRPSCDELLNMDSVKKRLHLVKNN